MDLTEEIRKQTEPLLASGQFVVDVLVSSKHGPRKITVIVDGDEGMGIDDCADISRSLSKYLDESGLVQEDNYLLEVSTPGLDQPLKMKRQYRKNIGRSLKVKLKERTTEGKLTEVTDDNIVIVEERGSGKKKELTNVSIPFSDIEKAFVMISFK